MNAARRTTILALCFGLSGCVGATIREPRLPPSSTHREWTNMFFWGLVGDSEVDVRDDCPAGAAIVQVGGEPVSTLLDIVTLGVYLPRVVRVTCGPVVHGPPRAGRFSAGSAR